MKLSRKKLTNWLLLLLAAGVFILVGIRTDWAQTWQSVKLANPLWLALAFCATLGAHWLRGARWSMLTTPAGYTLNTRRSFYAVMTGYLVNVATSRGGEVVRCAVASRSEKAPVELLIGTVVTERLVDLIMMASFAMLCLAVQFQEIYGFFDTYVFHPLAHAATPTNISILIMLLFAGILVLFMFRRRKKARQQTGEGAVQGILGRFAEGMKSVFNLRNPWLFIAMSAGIWTLYLLSGWCMLHSLPFTAHFTLGNALGVMIFSAIGIAIPLPAGAGVWGTVSFGLSTVYGLSTAQAETFGIYNVALSNLISIFPGAICYLLLYLEMQKQKNG
ncbi:MAG: flippase-like domain-containing protein [Bacteroidetes bacterium]|nr:flippase-like domain-containing protein [Bacteroidota bacterium]